MICIQFKNKTERRVHSRHCRDSHTSLGIETAGMPALEDHRVPLERNLPSLLDMDLGGKPLRDPNTGNRNLKSILKFTRGQ